MALKPNWMKKLSFKVIEFNKDAKRIILSHSRIFEDAAKAEERAEKKAASNAKKTTKREELLLSKIRQPLPL